MACDFQTTTTFGEQPIPLSLLQLPDLEICEPQLSLRRSIKPLCSFIDTPGTKVAALDDIKPTFQPESSPEFVIFTSCSLFSSPHQDISLMNSPAPPYTGAHPLKQASPMDFPKQPEIVEHPIPTHQPPMQQAYGHAPPVQHVHQTTQHNFRTATPIAALGRNGAPVDCPSCGNRAMTITNFVAGNTTQYVIAPILDTN